MNKMHLKTDTLLGGMGGFTEFKDIAVQPEMKDTFKGWQQDIEGISNVTYATFEPVRFRS